MKASLVMASALLATLPSAAHCQAGRPNYGPNTGNPTPAMAQQASAGAAADYLVGPGDVLGISVYRSPEMTTQLSVGLDGSVIFPELGRVVVANFTAAQIAQNVQLQLRRAGIMINPVVNVIITQLRAKRVSVMGAVARPGDVPLDREGLTLSAVLAQAGATFGTGDALVTIIESSDPAAPRRRVRIMDIISGAVDRPAKNGEVIIVEAAPQIYVTGEVGHPGVFPLQPNMTVDQALAMAGGGTTRGSIHRLRITRKQPDGSSIFIDKPKLNTVLDPNDVVFVKTRIF